MAKSKKKKSKGGKKTRAERKAMKRVKGSGSLTGKNNAARNARLPKKRSKYVPLKVLKDRAQRLANMVAYREKNPAKFNGKG